MFLAEAICFSERIFQGVCHIKRCRLILWSKFLKVSVIICFCRQEQFAIVSRRDVIIILSKKTRWLQMYSGILVGKVAAFAYSENNSMYSELQSWNQWSQILLNRIRIFILVCINSLQTIIQLLEFRKANEKMTT